MDASEPYLCPGRPGGGGCVDDGDPTVPACRYCGVDLAAGQNDGVQR